ncbi:T9SS type A sorting domain-containing protein [Lacinutrix sp. C3R15]|uniref:T9SS type A sorting domain-containing protein n=1 Tax=Flavobacteriaceae TaxID=49546 RepID=UPI001C0A35CA|nr:MULTISPECIES: T9SS type A sorting domain-containing protein [Flavobacteriaceae]MBU2938879.1 T9SS type A sorting domain-containing protein [Lacinutrix sp. C3R15]MDO6622192.1 T9SS type A sorting domain-containing protein [Oceanihabitans sp. 1_MG-2023]
MKKNILILVFFISNSLFAQTTYDLNWERNITGNADLTIELGDTVRWTWTDTSPHTVENVVGSAVETFNSGILTGLGETFSYTFTAIGTNDYFCGIHGAASMSGTITVDLTASTPEEAFKTFSILPNPASANIIIQLPNNSNAAEIEVYNILGKRIFIKSLNATRNTAINISSWQSGFYIIRVISGDNAQTKKFIKQ